MPGTGDISGGASLTFNFAGDSSLSQPWQAKDTGVGYASGRIIITDLTTSPPQQLVVKVQQGELVRIEWDNKPGKKARRRRRR